MDRVERPQSNFPPESDASPPLSRLSKRTPAKKTPRGHLQTTPAHPLPGPQPGRSFTTRICPGSPSPNPVMGSCHTKNEIKTSTPHPADPDQPSHPAPRPCPTFTAPPHLWGPWCCLISSLDSPDGKAPACTAAKQCVKEGRGSLAGGVRGLRATREGTHVGPQPTSPRKAPVWPQHLPAAPRPALQAPRPALGFAPWDPPAGPGRPEGLSAPKPTAAIP